jgi:hypothetical protein
MSIRFGRGGLPPCLDDLSAIGAEFLDDLPRAAGASFGA